eukprot:585474-Pyramimonas_sp.AAC.1
MIFFYGGLPDTAANRPAPGALGAALPPQLCRKRAARTQVDVDKQTNDYIGRSKGECRTNEAAATPTYD